MFLATEEFRTFRSSVWPALYSHNKRSLEFGTLDEFNTASLFLSNKGL